MEDLTKGNSRKFLINQQQQQQPFIYTHTTDKIITIDIIKLVESTAQNNHKS